MRNPTLALVVALVCAAWPLDVDASGQSDWQRFRGEYPYHIQAIALGPSEPGGRTLVVAEPPPSVTLRELQQTWPREFQSATIERHRVGVDGWVADIVTRLPPQSEEATTELVQQLCGHLFGTSYKSYALPIGAPRQAPAQDLDLSVGTAQLASWFGLQPPERGFASRLVDFMLGLSILISIVAVLRTRRLKWVLRTAVVVGALAVKGWIDTPPSPEVLFVERHNSRPPESLAQIMKSGGGLYDSEHRGLVVFVLPRSASLNSYQGALREFVLDTDSILGAVGTDQTIAIVGRERVVPVGVMPPLRVETLLQLAAVKSAELAQSYERNNFFAGRFDRTRHRDWAPIYLSADLKDTEYGSLLNITDQLLKSWSERGEVRYANFDYAAPGTFPFPAPLSKHVRASTVTFNWNTKGVGYSDTIGDFKLLAFARTGSLPVDYLGERDARLRDAEDTAYEYFAGSRDPNLARVVQYAGAYQIFRAFEVNATNPYTVPVDALDRTRLAALAIDRLALLRSSEAERFADEIAGTPKGRPYVEPFRRLVADLRAFHQRRGGRGDADLAATLIDPRPAAARARTSNSDYDTELVELTYALMDDALVKAMCGNMVRGLALQMYLGASSGGETNWIHTPTVVVSWPTGADAASVTGGHSLSSKVTRYAADDALSAGDIRVVESGDARTIFYSARDEARIHATVRQAGRADLQSPEALRDVLRQQLHAAQPRLGPVRQVLKLGDTVNAERGLGAHAGVRVSSATWTHRSGIHATHDAALQTLQRPGRLAVMVERQADGILMTVHGERTTIFAPDTPSAIDAFINRTRVRGGTSAVDVTFTNFDAEQARGFIRNAQLHARAGQRPQVNAAVDMQGNAAAVTRARTANWDIARATIETRPLNAAGDVVHTLAIPAKRAGSPLRLIVEATAEAASKVHALLQDFLVTVRAVSSAEELLTAFREFVNQLMAVPGVKKVRPLHVQEAGDIYFVRSGPTEVSHATE